MLLHRRMVPALLALTLSFTASAQEDRQSFDIGGSSGKYFPTRPEACIAAKTDARRAAELKCTSADGKLDGEPVFGACECQQGGFEEKEFLCSISTNVSCTVGGPSAPMPVPVDAPVRELTLDLPATPSRIALLDRVFARSGATLPPHELDKRLAAECSAGWGLACKASSWKEGGRHQLPKAEKPLEQSCAGGDDDACIALGWALEAKAIDKGDAAHFRAAARRYKTLCDSSKNATACYDYGSILFNEMGVTADPRLGLRRWQSACDLGSSAACTILARVHRTGLKTRVDINAAARFANIACAADNPRGCVEQAHLQADQGRVFDEELRACREGDVHMCADLAKGIESGARTEAGPELVPSLHDLGCQLGEVEACTASGRAALAAGDDAKAVDRFRSACKDGDVDACVGLTELILTDRADGNVSTESYAFEVACSKGSMATACSELGLALLDSDRGLTDQPRARALLQQSCTNEASPAKPCFILGNLYEKGAGGERDRTQAATYYKWACAQGWGDACDRRGDLLAEGVGVRRDHGDAVVMYQAGCDAGLPKACFKGGVLLDEGTYIPRDADRALSLFELSCERGVGEGCLRMGNLLLDPEIGRDEPRAREAYDSAVALGNIEAHRRLAYLLWNGLGGKKDKKRAKELTHEGCVNDDPLACRGPAFQTEG